MLDTIAYLGKLEYIENEIGEKTKTIVFSPSSYYVTQKSVKSSEFYQAMSTGLIPEVVISMNLYEYYDYYKDYDYNEECDNKFIKMLHPITNKYIEYTVIRTYEKDDDIEITLKRGVQNVTS